MPEPENGKFDSTLLLSVRVVLYVWLEVSYVSVYVGAEELLFLEKEGDFFIAGHLIFDLIIDRLNPAVIWAVRRPR